jgi:hypothetical protein
MVFRELHGKHFTDDAYHEAMRRVASKKSWSERLFSAKAAHGMLMFMSFVNIIGRLGASDQSGGFQCYTFPVYKKLDSSKFQGADQDLTLVPVHDPNYDRMPWASSDLSWGFELSVGPLAAAFVVGAVFSFYFSTRQSEVETRPVVGISLLSGVRMCMPKTL